MPVSWTSPLTGALESTKCAAHAAATSSPLAGNGFRPQLAFDGDRLIIGIIVVDVEGSLGEAGDEASRHQSLFKLGASAASWRTAGGGLLGGFAERRGRRLLRLSEFALDLLAKPPHLLRRHGLEAADKVAWVCWGELEIVATVDWFRWHTGGHGQTGTFVISLGSLLTKEIRSDGTMMASPSGSATFASWPPFSIHRPSTKPLIPWQARPRSNWLSVWVTLQVAAGGGIPR